MRYSPVLRDPSPDLRGQRPGGGGGTCQVSVSHGGALQPKPALLVLACLQITLVDGAKKRFSSPEDTVTFVANYKRSSSPN